MLFSGTSTPQGFFWFCSRAVAVAACLLLTAGRCARGSLSCVTLRTEIVAGVLEGADLPEKGRTRPRNVDDHGPLKDHVPGSNSRACGSAERCADVGRGPSPRDRALEKPILALGDPTVQTPRNSAGHRINDGWLQINRSGELTP